MQSTMQQPSHDSDQDKVYALRDISTVRQSLVGRTAAQCAAFLLHHLRPGMQLLDCGCGPGSITLDLAEIVAPAQVVGIDLDGESLDHARRLAAERNVSNARFEQGNFYNLPFPDGAFDAGFANAVLDHLQDPPAALAELKRVSRPGGVVGVRSNDSDGLLVALPEPLIALYGELQEQAINRNGGNLRLGKSLRGLLNRAGFVNVEASASYDYRGTPEAIHWMGNYLASSIVETDWADRETLEKINAAAKAWSENPDAFVAQCWCAAVGWVPKA